MSSCISACDEQPHESKSSRLVARIAAWHEKTLKGKAGVFTVRLILNVWPQYKLQPGEISHYAFVKWLVVQNIPNIGKLISTLLTQPANLSMHTQLHTQHHTLIRISFMLRHTAESIGD